MAIPSHTLFLELEDRNILVDELATLTQEYDGTAHLTWVYHSTHSIHILGYTVFLGDDTQEYEANSVYLASGDSLTITFKVKYL